MVYGQTEVTRDLIDARAAAGAPIVYEAEDVGLHDFDGDKPYVTLSSRTAPSTRSSAISSPAAMAFTASAGTAIPAGALTTFERVYPFGWLGMLADVPPVVHELIYANHERGFALCSMRSPTRSRYYIQCALDERRRRTGRTSASGTSCARLDPEAAPTAHHRPVDRKEHRAAAQLRRRADALRPPVPGRRRRPYRAAHGRQGPEPGRQRRALSVRGACIELLTRELRGRPRRLFRDARWRASGRPSAFPGG